MKWVVNLKNLEGKCLFVLIGMVVARYRIVCECGLHVVLEDREGVDSRPCIVHDSTVVPDREFWLNISARIV
jgi:hypothetical protein